MLFSMKDLAGGMVNLAGSASARSHLAPVRNYLNMARKTDDKIVIVLDFGGVESVTSSYVKFSIIWLILCGQKSIGAEVYEEPCDSGEPVAIPVFPIVANLNEETRSEMEIVLSSGGFCCMEAVEIRDEKVTMVTIIGLLDRTLRETIRHVVSEEEATATRLHQRYGDGINVTGWNNRLLDLHRLRLLCRRKEGRQWIYAPVKEVRLG